MNAQRDEKINRWVYRWLPFIAVALHSLLVLGLGWVIHDSVTQPIQSSTSGEAVMGWLIFMAIDFPIGFLAIPIELLFGPLLDSYYHFVILPGTTFLVLGGLQYYLFTKFIIYLAMRSRRKHPFPPHCPTCHYSLRGITSPRCPECGNAHGLPIHNPPS